MFPLVWVLWRSVWLLVAVLVWVSQLLVLGLGVVGWVLLDVGARHSWLRAWWVYPCVLGVFLAALQLPWRGVAGFLFFGFSCVVCVCGAGGARALVCGVRLWGSCRWRLWRCVFCARVGAVCWWCVWVPVLAFLAWIGGSVWVRGCVSWPLSRPGCGVRVWFPASPGWGLLVVVCPPVAPFACPPPSLSLPRRLGRCSPGASSRLWWVGAGGVLDAGSGPFPWCFPLGGPVLALPVRVYLCCTGRPFVPARYKWTCSVARYVGRSPHRGQVHCGSQGSPCGVGVSLACPDGRCALPAAPRWALTAVRAVGSALGQAHWSPPQAGATAGR